MAYLLHIFGDGHRGSGPAVWLNFSMKQLNIMPRATRQLSYVFERVNNVKIWEVSKAGSLNLYDISYEDKNT